MKPHALLLSLLILILGASQSYAAWAVALGSDGSPIVSRFNLPDTVRQNALSGCRQQGFHNCRIVASGSQGCLAMATTGKRWGVAAGGSKARADGFALEACTALHAGACKVVHDFCGQ